MKIALSQLNYIVGDFGFNRILMLESIVEASRSGVDLIIFSELSICSYVRRLEEQFERNTADLSKRQRHGIDQASARTRLD